MKYLIIAILLLPVSALAQQQNKFEPYTVTEVQHQAMLNYLGEIPAKYANPLINELVKFEREAINAKHRSETGKHNGNTPKH